MPISSCAVTRPKPSSWVSSHQIRPWLLAVAILLLAAACSDASPDALSTPSPSATPAPTVAATATGAGVVPTPIATDAPAPPAAAIPDAPRSDLFDLARRYRGVEAAPLAAEQLYAEPPVGSSRGFWMLDSVEPSARAIDATLHHVSRRALWYVDDRVAIDASELREAAEAFDGTIYPGVLDIVAPGLDVPGKIAIVHTPMRGVAGYFSPADALPQAVYPFSNEHAALFLHADDNFGSARYLGTLAHEFQHLVHWLVDPSEETWLNEGLSEFVAGRLGLPVLPHAAFFRSPNVGLTHWPTAIGSSLPNYAGAALFVKYLAGRTDAGEMHRLVAKQERSLEGIQLYLDETLPGLSLDDLLGDWMVANALNPGPPPYRYDDVSGSATIDRVIHGAGVVEGEVRQYGAWYAKVEPPRGGALRLTFEGGAATPLLPVAPHSGDACWWGNRGDSINATLARSFDLSDLQSATLRFWGWYDIEEWWDRAYVSASSDGGRTWTALRATNTRDNDPTGTAFGPGFTGRSGGWRQEAVDLSAFAGGDVLVRFEYVTDDSISAPGWCVDDIEVPELGFSDDVEGEPVWAADGFVRATTAGVSQRYLLRLVRGHAVEAPPLEEGVRGSILVDEPSIVAVMGVAPKTSEPARFALRVTGP